MNSLFKDLKNLSLLIYLDKLNRQVAYYLHLLMKKNLVLSSAPISKNSLLRRLKNLGKVKLIVLSGMFLQQDNSRIDILVVGDGIKRGNLEKLLRDVEAEIGKELSYALLTTEEFQYRLGMYDKFIRDILDYPHEKLLDKIGVE